MLDTDGLSSEHSMETEYAKIVALRNRMLLRPGDARPLGPVAPFAYAVPEGPRAERANGGPRKRVRSLGRAVPPAVLPDRRRRRIVDYAEQAARPRPPRPAATVAAAQPGSARDGPASNEMVARPTMTTPATATEQGFAALPFHGTDIPGLDIDTSSTRAEALLEPDGAIPGIDTGVVNDSHMAQPDSEDEDVRSPYDPSMAPWLPRIDSADGRATSAREHGSDPGASGRGPGNQPDTDMAPDARAATEGEPNAGAPAGPAAPHSRPDRSLGSSSKEMVPGAVSSSSRAGDRRTGSSDTPLYAPQARSYAIDPAFESYHRAEPRLDGDDGYHGQAPGALAYREPYYSESADPPVAFYNPPMYHEAYMYGAQAMPSADAPFAYYARGPRPPPTWAGRIPYDAGYMGYAGSAPGLAPVWPRRPQASLPPAYAMPAYPNSPAWPGGAVDMQRGHAQAANTMHPVYSMFPAAQGAMYASEPRAAVGPRSRPMPADPYSYNQPQPPFYAYDNRGS